MKVFVYGSLMKGEFNHGILKNETTTFLGEDATKEEYTFYDLGGFPGLVRGGTQSVVGEIYEISSFTRRNLDVLESHPQFYRRTKIELKSGEKVEAYILNEGYAINCPVIESGSWRKK